MGKPEADIILAIHQLKKDLSNMTECKHVDSNQDTRNTKKPTDAKQKKKGTTIECKIDQMATHTNPEQTTHHVEMKPNTWKNHDAQRTKRSTMQEKNC